MAVDFRDLKVWEEAMGLAEEVYRVTATFPLEERFGLAAQARRAAVSVPSCIAEGNARSSTRDYLRFLSMAKGSLAELHTQMLLASRLQYIGEACAAGLLSRLRTVSLLMQGLRKSLSSKLP